MNWKKPSPFGNGRNGEIPSTSHSAGAGPDLRLARRQTPDNLHVDRLPPHSPEAEQGVLGCCLMSPQECVPEVVAKFGNDPKAFYDLRHQTIFEAMQAMFALSMPIDLITLQQWLKDEQQLDQIGGIPYLNELDDGVPSAANLSYYIEIVAEKYLYRRLIQTCTEVVGRVYTYTGTPNELLDDVERTILAIRGDAKTMELVPIKQIVATALEEIRQKVAMEGAVSGISTGFPDLDKLTDGLHAGEMIVIAAPSSAGKTSLAMNIMENAILKLGLPVGVFSMEMTSVELVKRGLGSLARVNLRRVEHEDVPRLELAGDMIAAAKLYIDDTSDLSINNLRARARRMVQKFGIKLFAVDYIQLANASGGSQRNDNREQEVAQISSGLKNMAKELRVPVLVLSQLNEDGKLRESRRIGHDSDGVWILDVKDHKYMLWLDKQRSGPRNVCVPLTFLPQYTRFESAAKIDDDDIPPQGELYRGAPDP